MMLWAAVAFQCIAFVPAPMPGSESGTLSYFNTDQSPAQIGKLYYQKWSSAGFPVVVEGDFKREGAVSAFDTRHGTQTLLQVFRQGARTVGLLTVDVRTVRRATLARVFPPVEGSIIRVDNPAGVDDVVKGSAHGVRANILMTYASQGHPLTAEKEGVAPAGVLTLRATEGSLHFKVTITPLNQGLILTTQTQADDSEKLP